MIDKIKEIDVKFFEKISSLEWIMALMLLLSFFDFYLLSKYGLSVLDFEKLNVVKFGDYIAVVVIISLTVGITFPVVKTIFWQVFVKLMPIRVVNCFYKEKSYDDAFLSVGEARKKAQEENNQFLLEECKKKEIYIKEKRFVYESSWGIFSCVLLSLFFHFKSYEKLPFLLYSPCKLIEDFLISRGVCGVSTKNLEGILNTVMAFPLLFLIFFILVRVMDSFWHDEKEDLVLIKKRLPS